MDKKNVENILHALGEEITLDDFNKDCKTHNFSEEYVNKKNEITGLKEIYHKKNHKSLMKKPILLVATITTLLALSITAFGTVTHFSFTSKKDDSTGTVTYNYNHSKKVPNKVQQINIIPKYLPMGYVTSKYSSNEYLLNGDLEAPYISFYQGYPYGKKEFLYVSTIEDTEFNGVKAQIFYREGLENKIVQLYYDEGIIIGMYISNEIPMAEVKKICENVTYKKIPGEYVEIVEPIEDTNSENTDFLFDIPKKNIFKINKVTKDLTNANSSPLFTVNSMEILDKLPEVNKSCFWDYDEYASYINPDGTLKEYERIIKKSWENNKMNIITNKSTPKFLYVTLTMENPFDKELKFINICPRIKYLKDKDSSTLTDMRYEPTQNRLVNDEPFYFDRSDYSGKSFFFCDFKAKEKKVIHLAYAIDEDRLNEAYLTFNICGSGYSENAPCPDKIIKITK